MIPGLAAAAVAVPFVAALLGLLGGRRLPGAAAVAAVTGTLASAALAVAVLVAVTDAAAAVIESAVPLTPTGLVPIVLGVRVDALSATVAVMVGVVALAVQLFSIGYLRDGPRYSSYAALVSLFTAAMLLVVLSADLLVIYVGWEVMGICSYFLIGHHWEDRPTTAAAVKAFLMTRLGDVGFLFGIFVLGRAAGSFRVSDVLAAVPAMSGPTLLLATLLLIAGVVAKSAQFPLHSWLPDAMAGPAPVSALIHAATMVAAGAYIVARLYPAFLAAPVALDVLGVLAGITMVGSALAALATDDLKRVLAYSTVSQLALMFAGLAVGGLIAGVAHLLSHAAFKALLFLAAGAVIHTIGSNLMRDMGGLRRGMPVTFATMTVGFAALAGLPPTSGFVSKDAIVAAASHGGAAVPVSGVTLGFVLGCALLTVLLTAAYSTRAWLRTFFGPAPATAVHEAAPVMAVPLVALALAALLLGPVVLALDGLGFAALRPEATGALISLGLILLGALAAYAAWRRDPAADPATALGPARAVFERAFYTDDLYERLAMPPLTRLARGVIDVDDRALGRAVLGTARGTRGVGGVLRLSQNGNAQFYLTGMLAGILLIAVGVVIVP